MTLRQLQTRHTKDSRVCHHWYFHRLTCDEYDRLLARAGGCCEICGAPESETSGRRLVIDHFGAPGVNIVRGLICDTCNTTVMQCMDELKNWGEKSRSLMDKALAYIANSWDQPSEEDRVLMEAELERRRIRREGRARRRRPALVPPPQSASARQLPGLVLHTVEDSAGSSGRLSGMAFIEERVATVETDLGEIKEVLAGHTRSLTALERNTALMRDDIAELKAGQIEIANLLARIVAKLDGVTP